jgi:hypothetical protein
MTKTTKRTIIERVTEVPELFEDLQLPAGFGIDGWEKAEKQRITRLFGTIKGGVAVVGEENRQLFEALRREAGFWDTKRRLHNLYLLEQMGFAHKLAGKDEDDKFAERRMYDVAEYPVSDHMVNAIWPSS